MIPKVGAGMGMVVDTWWQDLMMRKMFRRYRRGWDPE